MKPVCVTSPLPSKIDLQTWRDFYKKKNIKTEIEVMEKDERGRRHYRLWRDMTAEEECDLALNRLEITKDGNLKYRDDDRVKKPQIQEAV